MRLEQFGFPAGDLHHSVQEVRMIEHFCEVVRGAAPRDDWPRRAIDTMRVCDALAQSARRETAVEVSAA